MPTSSRPHQPGNDAVVVERPAATGNADEMKNTTTVATASGRPQIASASLVRGLGPDLVRGLVCPVAIDGVSRSPRQYFGTGRAGGGRRDRIGDRRDQRDRQVMPH